MVNEEQKRIADASKNGRDCNSQRSNAPPLHAVVVALGALPGLPGAGQSIFECKGGLKPCVVTELGGLDVSDMMMKMAAFKKMEKAMNVHLLTNEQGSMDIMEPPVMKKVCSTLKKALEISARG